MSALPPAVVSHLTAGRSQIGTSLSFHLFFAVLGVGLPLMVLVAEGMHLRTGDEAWRALPGHAHHLICWYDASSRSSAVAGVNAEDDSAAIWAEPNFETYEEFLERAARHWKSRVDDVEREQTEQKQQTDVKSVGRLQRRQIDDERLRWFLQHQVWGVPAWGLAEQSNYDRDESTIRKAIAIVARAIKIPLRPQHGRHKRRK